MSGRPVVADLARRVVPALLLAPLFALLVAADRSPRRHRHRLLSPSRRTCPVGARRRGGHGRSRCPGHDQASRAGHVPAAPAAPNPTPAPRPSSAASPAPGTSGAVKSPGSVSVDLDPGDGKPSQTVSIILRSPCCRRAGHAAAVHQLHEDDRRPSPDPQRVGHCRRSRRTRCWPGWRCSSACSSWRRCCRRSTTRRAALPQGRDDASPRPTTPA